MNKGKKDTSDLELTRRKEMIKRIGDTGIVLGRRFGHRNVVMTFLEKEVNEYNREAKCDEERQKKLVKRHGTLLPQRKVNIK